MAKNRKKKKRFSFNLSFGKLKLFSLIIVVLALPLFLFMSNTKDKYENRSQAAIKKDLDSIDAEIKKNQKEKKDIKNTVLVQERKELMKELGYNYPEEFIKKAKTKEEREKFPKNQQRFMEEEIETTGVISLDILDNFDEEKSTEAYSFTESQTKNAYMLKTAGTTLDKSKNNKLKTIKGYKLEEMLVAVEVIDDPQAKKVKGVMSDNFNKIAVVPLKFKDRSREIFSRQELSNLLNSKKEFNFDCGYNCDWTPSLRKYYYDMSKGKNDIEVEVYDYLNLDMTFEEYCLRYYMAYYNMLQYPEYQIITSSDNDGVLFLSTQGSYCKYWAGIGTVGDDNFNTMQRAWVHWPGGYGSHGFHTTIHEIGHNLGLAHSALMQCKITGCTKGDSYGDLSDPMGKGTANFHALNKYRLGWLSESAVQTVYGPGEYNVYKTSGVNKPKLIKFDTPNNKMDIYIEYRAVAKTYDLIFGGTLYKDYYDKGILIHLWDSNNTMYGDTWLIHNRDINFSPTVILRDGWDVKVGSLGYKVKQIRHGNKSATFKIIKL